MTKYLINGIEETKKDFEAELTFAITNAYDDFLDSLTEEIALFGTQYSPSEAYKKLEPIDYNRSLRDYRKSNYSGIKEDLSAGSVAVGRDTFEIVEDNVVD